MTRGTIKMDRLPELIQLAMAIRERAYAPYSRYRVGAAVLTDSGLIFEGVNIENAAYPSSMCAERTAIFKAVSEGEQGFAVLVVATDNGGSPCGACRQVMREFAPDLRLVMVNGDGEVVLDADLQDLLPHSFGPEHLPSDL